MFEGAIKETERGVVVYQGNVLTVGGGQKLTPWQFLVLKGCLTILCCTPQLRVMSQHYLTGPHLLPVRIGILDILMLLN